MEKKYDLLVMLNEKFYSLHLEELERNFNVRKPSDLEQAVSYLNSRFDAIILATGFPVKLEGELVRDYLENRNPMNHISIYEHFVNVHVRKKGNPNEQTKLIMLGGKLDNLIDSSNTISLRMVDFSHNFIEDVIAELKYSSKK